MPRYYLDASAFVKLFDVEPESEALRATVDRGAVASDLLAIEARRVSRRIDPAAMGRAEEELERMRLVPIDRRVRDLAGSLGPPSLRSLDAIHLATAHLLRDRLSGLITYDRRLSDAAEAVGIPVLSPR